METTEENEDGTGAEAETEVGAPIGDVIETIDDEVLIVPRDETKGIATGIVIVDTAETAMEIEAETREMTNVMTREARGETRGDREIGAGSGIVRDQGSIDDGALDRIHVETINVAVFNKDCCSTRLLYRCAFL